MMNIKWFLLNSNSFLLGLLSKFETELQLKSSTTKIWPSIAKKLDIFWEEFCQTEISYHFSRTYLECFCNPGTLQLQ